MKPSELTAEGIVTQIMTQHWDLHACNCWVCEAGRRIGIGAQEDHLPHHSGFRFSRVCVDESEGGGMSANEEKHDWCLLRTQVQPNSGWGTLCEGCDLRFDVPEGDYPCAAWEGTSRLKPNLLRYSNTGHDVKRSEVMNKTFVEICAAFSVRVKP
ncbi:hypothetical protein LCGC14_2273250 [marine sediment metagenome]|uniref:Uncharacterized protein n=1 Tax=marine sediment metagenome TaxID=412755 RepID=A0A0F9CWH4_9ZZZZ